MKRTCPPRWPPRPSGGGARRWRRRRRRPWRVAAAGSRSRPAGGRPSVVYYLNQVRGIEAAKSSTAAACRWLFYDRNPDHAVLISAEDDVGDVASLTMWLDTGGNQFAGRLTRLEQKEPEARRAD